MRVAQTAIYCVLLQSILCVHSEGGAKGEPNANFCSLVDLNKVDSTLKAKKISENDIQGFFTVMDSRCTSVVEAAERSNDLLFQLMEVEMETFLKVAGSKATTNRQRAFIINQIENPIHDNISLDSIQFKLEKSQYAKSKFGRKVDQALRVAIKKSE